MKTHSLQSHLQKAHVRQSHCGPGCNFCFPSAVTIARAIELKHNATLIAALAFETANYYQRAGEYFLRHCPCSSIRHFCTCVTSVAGKCKHNRKRENANKTENITY